MPDTSNTAESLSSYVTLEDADLPRVNFLRTIASRILDDIAGLPDEPHIRPWDKDVSK